MPIGARTHETITEAIRVRDKVILILSEDSIYSDWVDNEVSTAFDEEKKRDELVLFPIRVDAAVFEPKSGWIKRIQETRNIGDFSNWKDHDRYQKAFERLLRDLQS